MSHVSRGFTPITRTLTAKGYSDVATDAPADSLSATKRWGSDVSDVAHKQIDSAQDLSASVWHGRGATRANPNAGQRNGLDRAAAALHPAPGSDVAPRDKRTLGNSTPDKDGSDSSSANPPATP